MASNNKRNNQAEAVAPHDDDDCGVIIIGAGAAGLTAAYDLKRKGVPFVLLEAHASELGGRLRKLEGFADDFPIDLGGEWIHVHPRILEEIVDDDNRRKPMPKTRRYEIDPFRVWTGNSSGGGGTWTKVPWNALDYKFVRSTWYDFFHDYIAQSVLEDIRYGCVVKTIDYSSSSSGSGGIVQVKCANGELFRGNQVIVTVPLQILRDKEIEFLPPLSAAKQRAIADAPYEQGLKIFLEFSEHFYYRGFEIKDVTRDGMHGEIYFWDETYLQGSTKQHIMGVFVYGACTRLYADWTDEEIVTEFLQQLDLVFEGRASRAYIKSVVQNWTKKEPYIRGLYSSYRKHGMRPLYTIAQPVNNKVFFAGEALPPDGHNYGYVHGAALSGRHAAKEVDCVRRGKRRPFKWTACLVHALSTVCCGLEHRLFFNEEDN